MKKLTKDQIKLLPEGVSKQYVKLTRLHWPEPKVVFEGDKELFIRRREKTLKRGRTIYPAGQIVEITLYNGCWAVADERDIENNGSIVVEDYMMEIFS
jgi:hypothetical protein